MFLLSKNITRYTSPSEFTLTLYPSCFSCRSSIYAVISSISFFVFAISNSASAICNASFSFAATCMSLAFPALFNNPFSPNNKFSVTPAKISRTIIVTINATNVIPVSLKYVFILFFVIYVSPFLVNSFVFVCSKDSHRIFSFCITLS